MKAICHVCQSRYNLRGEDSLVEANKVTHCADCDVCIVEIDHHCVFFDGCIAKKNDCMFGCVLLGFFTILIYVMIFAAIAAHNGELKEIKIV